jgi:hypothetical protein
MAAPFITTYSLASPAPIPAASYDLRGVDQIADFVGASPERMAYLLGAGFPARKLDGEWAARSRHLTECFDLDHHRVAAE